MTRSRCHVTTAFLGCLVVAMALPALAIAHAAWITGGTANADWTQGKVDNMALAMDECASSPTCRWEAVAGVMPMARGNCPSDWAAGADSGFSTFWRSGYQLDDGVVHSGPQQFALDGTAGQRVCLYLERSYPDGSRASFRWSSKQLQVPSAPPPTDEPPPAQLTSDVAQREARQALKRRFGRRFTRGDLRRLRCVEGSQSEYDCAVKWTYRQRRYTGDVLIAMAADGQITTKLEIRRQRLP